MKIYGFGNYDLSISDLSKEPDGVRIENKDLNGDITEKFGVGGSAVILDHYDMEFSSVMIELSSRSSRHVAQFIHTRLTLSDDESNLISMILD